MKHETILEGNGLKLCPLEVKDASERYLSWLRDPIVTAETELRFTCQTLESLRDYIAQCTASPCDKIWRIIIKGDTHVGNIRLSSINWNHNRGRVALLIGDKSVWGKGIGSAAIDCLAHHAFEDMRLHKLSAGIYSSNPGSRRAFEKAKFTLEAALKDEAFVGERFLDVWLMSRFA